MADNYKSVLPSDEIARLATNTNSSGQRRNYARDRPMPSRSLRYVRRSPNWTSPPPGPRSVWIAAESGMISAADGLCTRNDWRKTTACCHKLPSIVGASNGLTCRALLSAN